MKTLLFYAAVTGLIVVSSFTSEAQANDSEAVKELIALSNEWMQALERKDKNRLEQIMHRDFFILGMVNDETPTHREQWLKNGMEDSDWRDFRYDDFNVSVLGDLAIVRSTLDFTAQRRTGLIRKVSTSAPLIDVWIKQDGRWQIIRRYPAPWTVRRWVDRGIGLLLGIGLAGILLFIWSRFIRRNKGLGAKP